MMDLRDLFTLEGKAAVVTGGSRGIGAMITEGLMAAGCRVYISSRTESECRTTAETLADRYPVDCTPIVADLSNLEGVEALVAEVQSREQGIDVLVNNAGAIWGQPFDQFVEKGWDRVMNLNAKSVFFLTQKMLPLLKSGASSADPSRVINITSVLGARTDAMMAYSYCASKAALTQITRNLAYDLATDNITVNGIAPGYFPSKMTSHIEQDEEADAQMLARARFPRKGHAEEMAGVAIYLCSRSGAFVTGEIIGVDGGLALAC